ncbi:MAG: hypothetical protein GXX98_17270 [Planctomycetes bacterium]|jgi:hypothetical protein|nr:hypothetical protein [Planctomycetota bacterium]
MSNLIQMARQKLWLAEAGFDEEGNITLNADSLAGALDANCRLLVKGRQPTWVPFAIAESVEVAQSCCDVLEEAICRYALEHGQPKPITLHDQLIKLVRQWQDREEETEDAKVTVPAEVAGRWEH